MPRRPAGFTLVEMLIVIVIIGILASIAIIRYSRTKENAILSSLKADLHSVVTLEAAFQAQHNDFAGGAVATGVPDTTMGGAGQILFAPSPGNTVAITYRGNDGFSALATSTGTTKQCGIYIGKPSYAPNAAVTADGVPICW